MRVLDSFLDAMGNTPLVRLSRVGRSVEPTILAKLEMLNPGGSVKDRIGLRMIEAAERAGRLRPGGTIVEPTSGNTGHGLAIAAAIRGYKCIFVMPDKMSLEKIALLRAYGAEVVITPTAVAPESPRVVLPRRRPADRGDPRRLSAEPVLQSGEPEGARGDDRTRDLGADGGGDRRSGRRRRHRRNHHRDGQVPEADEAVASGGRGRPRGFGLLRGDPRPYLTEGIGEDFWPETFDPSVVDRWIRVSDRDAFLTARAITRQEGILVGGSAGTAVFAALQTARDMAAGDLIVVILPDTGRNYLSKLYSDSWLMQHGFLERAEAVRVEEVLGSKAVGLPPLITVGGDEKVRQAVDRLQEHGISQAPVTTGDPLSVSGLIGSVRDRELLDRVFRDPDVLQADVAEVMGPPLPLVEKRDPVELAFARLQASPAVIVTSGGQALGVLTRSDLLEFLAHRRREDPPA